MTETAKTPEQLAAEATAAKNAEKAKKEAEKAAAKEAKAKKEAEKNAAKAAAEAKKAEDKAKKEAEAKAKAEKEAEAKKAKEAAKQPEQNGVRRPKDGGACGKVWGLADSLSSSLGQPVPISELSKAAGAQGINDSTIRTQYALWRKFHGITGRVSLPAAAPAPAPAPGAAAA